MKFREKINLPWLIFEFHIIQLPSRSRRQNGTNQIKTPQDGSPKGVGIEKVILTG